MSDAYSPLSRPVGLCGGRGRLTVGLLGGSFNPAHEGHLHISRQALRRLGLDEIWWLVTPQNPMKPSEGMEHLAARVRAARRIARDPHIRVTDLERRLGTCYSADTIAALKRAYPHIRFVWLIGADLVPQLPQWHRWRHLMDSVPVAIVSRPPYGQEVTGYLTASGYSRERVPERKARRIGGMRPPAWVYLNTPTLDQSSTRIRTANAIREAATRPQTTPDPDAESRRVRDVALGVLDRDKAQDVVTIPLASRSAMADFMIVASGTSHRHVASMANHLSEALGKEGVRGIATEGLSSADWVLLDAGDIIVHLFRPEVRRFYNLERLWVDDPHEASGDAHAEPG